MATGTVDRLRLKRGKGQEQKEKERKEDRCGDPVISALGPKLAIFDAQMPLSIPARAQQNSDFKDQLFP